MDAVFCTRLEGIGATLINTRIHKKKKQDFSFYACTGVG